MISVWERIEKVYQRHPSSLVFQKSFCVCKCVHCEALPTLLHNLSCGCRLCDRCLKHEGVNSVSINCPTHKTSTHLRKVKSIELKADDVIHTKAYCRNKVNGCKQVDTIKNLHCHEELECSFSFTECPMKCGKELLLKDIAHHLSSVCGKRIVKCKHCDTDIMLFRTETHHKTCSMFPLQCQYCGMNLKRHQLPQHVEECEQKPVPCKFREMGCPLTDKRINISRHETFENHSVLIMTAFDELKNLKIEAQFQRDSTKEELEVMRNTIEELRDEQNRSLQDTEDSLEEVKNIKEWTLEKIDTLEKQVLQARDSTRPKEANIWLTHSSARYQSSAKIGFKSSTPKSKRTEATTDSKYLKCTEERGTQTDNSKQDGVALDQMETRVKEIDEQTSSEANKDVTEGNNTEHKRRLRRNSPIKESQPISPSTKLVYPKGATRITVSICVILAVLLIISASYVIIKYANNIALNYYKSSSYCP